MRVVVTTANPLTQTICDAECDRWVTNGDFLVLELVQPNHTDPSGFGETRICLVFTPDEWRKIASDVELEIGKE